MGEPDRLHRLLLLYNRCADALTLTSVSLIMECKSIKTIHALCEQGGQTGPVHSAKFRTKPNKEFGVEEVDRGAQSPDHNPSQHLQKE